ncbi:cell division protein ZipA C-terminal FtsZ-binding domain-containing protein [Sinobacterium caligoides]|nr:cell division protein ZipA C-terminal FtsZ-binding domain-containing protein [Sinobacterium caligoides]
MRVSKTAHDPIDDYLSELPNGGARVVKRTQSSADKETSSAKEKLSFVAPSMISVEDVGSVSTEEKDEVSDITQGADDYASVEGEFYIDQQSRSGDDEASFHHVDSAFAAGHADENEAIDYPDISALELEAIGVDGIAVEDIAVDDVEGFTSAGQMRDEVADHASEDVEDSVPVNSMTSDAIAAPEIDQSTASNVAFSDLEAASLANDEEQEPAHEEHLSFVDVEEQPEWQDVVDRRNPDLSFDDLVEGEQAELDVGQVQKDIVDVFDDLSFTSPASVEPRQKATTAEASSRVREPQQYRANPFKVPEQQSFDLDEGVPMLMDSLAEDEDAVADLSTRHGFVPRKVPKKGQRKASEIEQPVVEQEIFIEQAVVHSAEPEVDDTLPSSPEVTAPQELSFEEDEPLKTTDFAEEELVEPEPTNSIGFDATEVPVSTEAEAAMMSEPVTYSEPARSSKKLFSRLASTLEDMPVFGKSEQSSVNNHEETFEEAELMSQPEQAPTIDQNQRVEIINVRSKDAEGFDAGKLHSFFKACDIQLNKSKIYLRHEEAAGKGAVQFSVANLVDSGVFAPDDTGDIYIPGVCFYLTLPGPKEPLNAFEAMLQTAEYLAKNLGGMMKDREGSDINKQVLEYYRYDIREYCRKNLTDIG